MSSAQRLLYLYFVASAVPTVLVNVLMAYVTGSHYYVQLSSVAICRIPLKSYMYVMNFLYLATGCSPPPTAQRLLYLYFVTSTVPAVIVHVLMAYVTGSHYYVQLSSELYVEYL
jgi:hypothetical protein